MRDHAEADELVRKTGASFTLLRPHLYTQNLLRAAETVRRDGVRSAPMVSPTVAALLGREPRSLRAFLADHGGAFRPAHS